MAKYYKGFDEARRAVEQMSVEQLLAQVDALYGRERLKPPYTLDQLRAEALRQTRLDWLDPSDSNFDISRRVLES